MAEENELSNPELRHLLTETLSRLADVASIVADLANMGTRQEKPNVRHVADAREALKKINALLASLK
jgi:hypothetical protein